MNKKILLMFLFVIVGFSLFNIFNYFNSRPKFQEVSSRTTYIFDEELNTTMIHNISIAFENSDDLYKSLGYFNDTPREQQMADFEKVITKYFEKSKLQTSLLDFETLATEDEGLLKVQETAVMKGLVILDEGLVKTMFESNQLNLPQNSRLIFIIPEDSDLILAEPEPTMKEGNVLTWIKSGVMNLPKVYFKLR